MKTYIAGRMSIVIDYFEKYLRKYVYVQVEINDQKMLERKLKSQIRNFLGSVYTAILDLWL